MPKISYLGQIFAVGQLLFVANDQILNRKNKLPSGHTVYIVLINVHSFSSDATTPHNHNHCRHRILTYFAKGSFRRTSKIDKTLTGHVLHVSKIGLPYCIAQWIRLRLSSCGPGSNPKHTINAFSIYCQLCYICHCIEKRTKTNNKKRRPSLAHI